MGTAGAKIRVGVHYEPSTVDPQIGAAELALQMTNGVFDTLVNRTADGNYLPGLAETFEMSEDGKRYRLVLRQDVLFHDGTPFNAAAVAFTLDRARDPINESKLAGCMLGSYLRSEIVDEFTIDMYLAKPYGLFLDALSQGWLAPVSPTAVERFGEAFGRCPVGTGPFRFSEWRAGHSITLVRNEAYAWAPPMVNNTGPVAIAEIQFCFLADPAERSRALESGEVDMIFYVAPDTVQTFRESAGFKVDTFPIRGIPVCMMMNLEKVPTDSLLVRQAINTAIDQDALVAEVFRGEFERAYGPVSQFTLGFEPEVQHFYPYRPSYAEEFLDEAGWLKEADGYRYRNGRMLSVEFFALPVNFYPEFGRIVTEQLRKVGIEVNVQILDPVPWIQAGMAGNHHLIPQGKYASTAELLPFVYHSRNSGADGYGWSKRTADHRPGLDALLESVEEASDPEVYLPLLKDIQKMVMQEALVVPLHCNTNIVASRDDIRGLAFDAIGAYPLWHDVERTCSEVNHAR